MLAAQAPKGGLLAARRFVARVLGAVGRSPPAFGLSEPAAEQGAGGGHVAGAVPKSVFISS